MAVKIVTDTLSDMTHDLATKLGISVVPLYVRFGDKVFKDRVEMTTDEFYYRLQHDPNWPSTTQPTPNDFFDVFNKLADETDEILCIDLSHKLSGTYESACAAKRMMTKKCRIEVIDSMTVVMGLGTLVIDAAKAAQEGAKMDDLIARVRRNMDRSHAVMYFDTLKYLAKGGRIGRAQGLLGSLLSVKPILLMHEGEVAPLTRVRSRQAGLDYLYNFVKSLRNINELAVEYATTPEDAKELMERLNDFFPKERIVLSTVSPVIGTYTGPHVICVAAVADKQ
jgi:DegV family protein with EDD domain